MTRVRMSRTIKFNLNDFLQELSVALEGNTEGIDDVVQTYKDFISNTEEPLLSGIKKYVSNHFLVCDNERMQSFISVCYP